MGPSGRVQISEAAALSGGADLTPLKLERMEIERLRIALTVETRRRVRTEQLCRQHRADSLKARDDEQRRIARELHDQLGQSLTALKLGLATARRAAPSKLAAALERCEQACRELERDLAEVTGHLRPLALGELGLQAALKQLVSGWAARTGIEVDLEASDLSQRLPEDLETALYRLVQEALTNVARHARASRVSVVVQRTATHAVASVEDDGVGFNTTISRSGHFGLVGMRERIALCGGALEVQSRPGAGTCILARVPLGPSGAP